LNRGGRASDSKRKKSDRIPEEAAVLAIISQGDRYGLKFGNRLSHPGDLWLKPLAPLQVTAVLADRFVSKARFEWMSRRDGSLASAMSTPSSISSIIAPMASADMLASSFMCSGWARSVLTKLGRKRSIDINFLPVSPPVLTLLPAWWLGNRAETDLAQRIGI
jgi:hypothetical protein